MDQLKTKSGAAMRSGIVRAGLVAVAAAGLIGCTNGSPQDQTAAGGLLGASMGYVTARALNAHDGWTALAVVAGAATGAMVAQNEATGQCAWSNGDGTYRKAACP